MIYFKNYYTNYNENNIPNDILDFFEKKVKERGILKIIFTYLSTDYNQYMKYIKQLKTEDDFVNNVISMHKILLHQIKYHKNNILDAHNGLQRLVYENHIYQGRNIVMDNIFSTCKITYQSNSDNIVFATYADILSYFSLKNYNIGDHFVIECGYYRIKEIIITTENKNNLWTIFKYNLPAFLISALNREFRIRCLNRPLNQYIDSYYIYLSTNLRCICAQNVVQLKHNGNIYHQYENRDISILEY